LSVTHEPAKLLKQLDTFNKKNIARNCVFHNHLKVQSEILITCRAQLMSLVVDCQDGYKYDVV